MPTNCTACGHKPNPKIKYGDPAPQLVKYYTYKNGDYIACEEFLCGFCVTLINVAIHRKITEQKKTLAERKPLG